METKRNARVLIARELATDGKQSYVAQVLDFDLATQADSIDAITYEIQRMICAHILCSEQEGIDPFAVPSAPKFYEDQYVAAKQTWTVGITRTRADQPIIKNLPDLAFRFAPGV